MAKSDNRYDFKGRVWLYPGMVAWHFVTLPKKESEEIKARYVMLTRGFGSLKVKVMIGKTSWDTSIFPDKKEGTYLLPIKASVRKKEKIQAGETIGFTVEIKGG